MAKRRKKSSFPFSRTSLISLGIIIILILLVAIFTPEELEPLLNILMGITPTATIQVPTEPQPDYQPTAPSVQDTETTGDWWQVYFTSPLTINDPEILSGSIPEHLIGLIDNTQVSIHIASFEFNLTPVAEALINAQKRGVDVRWVTDDEHGIEADEEDDHGQFAMLEEAGIEIVDDERSALMHNKFWIFDSKTVWTGSTNITKNGNFRNNNNVIIIHSPELATIYEREFEEMWNGEFGPTSTSTINLQATIIDGTQIQVLFAAEDEVVSYLTDMVSQARSDIHFMAFSFTHDDLGTAMLERAAEGVPVTGIFEKRGSETEYSELTALFCANLPVRQDGNPGTFHHKVIIIDNHIVVTGSLNFSENADSSNDENVLIIDNSEIAALYLEEFDRRWLEAEDPDPNDLSCR
jgi:phosphatidylserine/phosphatidylglycerophosphate/cardiolipin synthase-like enzyme